MEIEKPKDKNVSEVFCKCTNPPRAIGLVFCYDCGEKIKYEQTQQQIKK